MFFTGKRMPTKVFSRKKSIRCQIDELSMSSPPFRFCCLMLIYFSVFCNFIIELNARTLRLRLRPPFRDVASKQMMNDVCLTKCDSQLKKVLFSLQMQSKYEQAQEDS